MITLIVSETIKNGQKKNWKLSPTQSTHSFGASRWADMISISQTTQGIQGLFEFRDNQWWYTNLGMTDSIDTNTSNTFSLSNSIEIKIGDSILQCESIEKKMDPYRQLENGNSWNETKVSHKKVQLYIVKQSGLIIMTKIQNLNKTFRVQRQSPEIKCVPAQQWHKDYFEDIEISQRTISIEDTTHLGKFTADQIIDKDSKKGALLLVATSALIIMVAVFSPRRSEPTKTLNFPQNPIVQKIIVKTEIKNKLKKQTAAQTVMFKGDPPTGTPQTSKLTDVNQNMTNNSGGGKISNMMNSFSKGRISQLISKVSAQAARSSNVIIAQGVKAGSAPSGRALSAVGTLDRSGQDWGTAGKGTGVMISTNGKGGGKNASAMGGLSAGGTGKSGVGLIEEESEIIGGLDREVIAQYIKSKLGQILYCYERQLSANPDLFGKVAVKFTIGPTGSVEQQLIGDTSLNNATVEGCILNRVASWKFPIPQGGTKVLVTYPFLFKSTN